MTPWLHRFFEVQEIQLVLDLVNQKEDLSWERDFLDRCYRRGIIQYDADAHVAMADFHIRYDIWALFEGWQDVPSEIRTLLNQWEIDSYVSRKRPFIEASQKAGHRDPTQAWSEFVLLEEALELIDCVSPVYQWPCNCRAMMKGCRKPEYVCLRFNNDRNLGWEISKSRAKDILNAGLSLFEDGHIDGGICNCCTDCCYDHQLAEALDIKRIWPLNRYQASFSAENCSACGRCTKRCLYHAFTLTDLKKTHYVSNLCRGCGLCASSCPENAIEMIPLPLSPFSIVDTLLNSF
ncbi:MAG: 4Fe-4S binding protein [SAR324 cluster bacterium]|nr:4Fe-4S binding protein [SAR324 cluster bacterium]